MPDVWKQPNCAKRQSTQGRTYSLLPLLRSFCWVLNHLQLSKPRYPEDITVQQLKAYPSYRSRHRMYCKPCQHTPHGYPHINELLREVSGFVVNAMIICLGDAPSSIHSSHVGSNSNGTERSNLFWTQLCQTWNALRVSECRFSSF